MGRGDRGRLEPPSLSLLVERRRGVQDRGPRGLAVDVGVGHHMLERLEAADRPSELLALPRVLDGEVERGGGGADPLGRRWRPPRRRTPTRARRRRWLAAQRRLVRHDHVVQLDHGRRAGGVDAAACGRIETPGASAGIRAHGGEPVGRRRRRAGARRWPRAARRACVRRAATGPVRAGSQRGGHRRRGSSRRRPRARRAPRVRSPDGQPRPAVRRASRDPGGDGGVDEGGRRHVGADLLGQQECSPGSPKPSSSSTPTAYQPSSARSACSGSAGRPSKKARASESGARASSAWRATSRSSRWSGVSSRSIRSALRKAEDALGDDVLLDLRAAAVDRGGAAVEVGVLPAGRVGRRLASSPRAAWAPMTSSATSTSRCSTRARTTLSTELSSPGWPSASILPDAPVALVLEHLERDVRLGQRRAGSPAPRSPGGRRGRHDAPRRSAGRAARAGSPGGRPRTSRARARACAWRSSSRRAAGRAGSRPGRRRRRSRPRRTRDRRSTGPAAGPRCPGCSCRRADRRSPCGRARRDRCGPGPRTTARAARRRSRPCARRSTKLPVALDGPESSARPGRSRRRPRRSPGTRCPRRRGSGPGSAPSAPSVPWSMSDGPTTSSPTDADDRGRAGLGQHLVGDDLLAQRGPAAAVLGGPGQADQASLVQPCAASAAGRRRARRNRRARPPSSGWCSARKARTSSRRLISAGLGASCIEFLIRLGNS